MVSGSAFASGIVGDLGLTLLHSIWQIASASICLALSLRLLRTSARVRHNLCLITLLVCVALPVATFIQIRVAGGVPSTSTTPAFSDDTESGESELWSASPRGIEPKGSEIKSSTYAAPAASVSAIGEYIADALVIASPLVVAGWLFGVFGMSLRLVGGLVQLHGFRSRGVSDPEPAWRERFDRMFGKFQIPFKPRLAVSERIGTPVSIGFFRPLILIPAAAFMHVGHRELEMVIAHELIHLRRLDPLVSVLASMAETIFFYHPAVWWVTSRLREEREFATDLEVTQLFGGGETDYARALAAFEELRHSGSTDRPRLAPAANGGNLMLRIERILNGKTEARGTSSAWTACLALALASAFVLGAFWFNSSGVVNAQNKGGRKKVAIGFVSIPPVDRTANAPLDSDATMRLLIDALKRNKVPALGFLQGGMVSDGEKLFPARAAIARQWRDAGFEIGLGGFRHIWLQRTPVEEYIANIEKNERVAKQLIGETGPPPRYFSYPFLNTGKSEADRVQVESWLAGKGYTPVKYTIDNSEWMYSYAYDIARIDNDSQSMREIRERYLEYMSGMVDHFEAYSKDMFGRDVPQTMVLTPSRLVTDTADDFFKMLSGRGYSLVPVGEAQSDPAYKTAENFTGDAGISWFERWAMAKNLPLREEPKVDPSIQRVWDAKGKDK